MNVPSKRNFGIEIQSLEFNMNLITTFAPCVFAQCDNLYGMTQKCANFSNTCNMDAA